MYLLIRETRQPGSPSAPHESFAVTLQGYTVVLKDKIFLSFLLISMIGILAYTQMNTTLGVYLRDTHAVTEQNFGLLISLNATMVVLFQYAISKHIRPYPPLLVMAAGGIFYAAGFSMYGYTRIYPLFMLAMAVITLGEMVQAPVSTSWVSKLAPEDMRGRYMAIYGLSWLLPETLGVTLGGVLMDNYDPRLLWYFAGTLALLSAFGCYWLHHRLQKQTASPIH